MKKMSMILAVLAAMMIAGGALALTDTEAETAARAYVPAEAQLTWSEMDDGMHELTFRVEATGEKYEIQVNPNTGAVVKIESERPLHDADRRGGGVRGRGGLSRGRNHSQG